MAKLIIRDSKGERVHEIADDVTTFGRSSANIIQVKDEKASRQHCRIERAGDGYRLVDLGSRNGTEVNGVKVSGQTLKPGDAITIGEFKVIFDAPLQVSGEELGATVAVEPLSAADAKGAPATAPAPAAAPTAIELKPAEPKPAEPAAPRFILEVVEGAAKGKTVELGLEPITIGRHPSNKLAIEDEAASNYHAEVTKEAIGYVISDLGSTNGTKVNGEKVVKSPLAHGVRVRIGATEIVFKNLGAPTEEDAVFGTVVMDSEKLDLELAAARKSGGAAGFLKLLAAAAVLAGAVWGGCAVVRWLRTPPVFIDPATGVANSSFRGGIDNNGNPRNWQVDPGDGRNSIVVDKGKGRESALPGKPEPEKYSVEFQRESGTPLDTRMECRQSETFVVDQASAYCAAVYVKSPGARGLYGLRLTWLESDDAGSRRLDEYETISGAHPDWDKVELSARPPSWAGKLQLALVAFGNSGNVWFDDASLKKVPASQVERTERTVDFGGVKAGFDKCGRVELERAGQRALRGQIVAEGQGRVATRQELARPAQGYPREQGEETLFKGAMFEFSRRVSFTYEEAASKAADGVRVRYGFATEGPELTLDGLSLDLMIEPAYAGGAEAYTATGKKALAAAELSGVNEVVLHAVAGGKVLAIAFDQPAVVKMEPLGERRRLRVLLAKEPSLGSAPREFTLTFARSSASAAHLVDVDFDEVARLFAAKDWKEFPAAARQVRARYPAAEQLKKLDEQEKQYADVLADARQRLDEALERARGAVGNSAALKLACEQGRKAIEGLEKEWPDGTALASRLADGRVEFKKLEDKIVQDAEEQAAQELYDKGVKAMEAEAWALARTYFDTILKRYPGTRVAANIKRLELIKNCEDNQRQDEIIAGAEESILKAIRNDELNSREEKAVEFIERDLQYRKYGPKKMKLVAAKLEELKLKLKQRPKPAGE